MPSSNSNASFIPALKRALATGNAMLLDKEKLRAVAQFAPELLEDYFAACVSTNSRYQNHKQVFGLLRSDIPHHEALTIACAFTSALSTNEIDAFVDEVLICFLPRPEVSSQLVLHLVNVLPKYIHLSDKVLTCMINMVSYDWMVPKDTTRLTDMLVDLMSVLDKHGHGLRQTSPIAPSPLVKFGMLLEANGWYSSKPDIAGSCLDALLEVWQDFRSDLTDNRLSGEFQQFLLSRPIVRKRLLSEVAQSSVHMDTPHPPKLPKI